MVDALGRRRDAKRKFLNKRRASDLEKLNRVHENGRQCGGQQRERVNYIENEEIVVLENEEVGEGEEGRRIVELGRLTTQLKSCKTCGNSVHLHDCQKEMRYGLGSILYILCRRCSYVNLITTEKRRR